MAGASVKEPGLPIGRLIGMVRRFFTAVLVVVGLAACGGGVAATVPTPSARLEVTAVAGPICPVETDPPTPECEARPVEGALIILKDAEGSEMARGTTGSDGRVTIDVGPGEVTVVPQPVEGLMGTAPEVRVTVTSDSTSRVTVVYDTGIR